MDDEQDSANDDTQENTPVESDAESKQTAMDAAAPSCGVGAAGTALLAGLCLVGFAVRRR